MLTQTALEVLNIGAVLSAISGRRQQLQPDGVAFETTQPEHPLQRHRKIAASVAVFCRKAAAEKDRHPGRMAGLNCCSSMLITQFR